MKFNFQNFRKQLKELASKAMDFSIKALWLLLSIPFFRERKNVWNYSNGHIIIRDYSTFLYPLRPERSSWLRMSINPASEAVEQWVIKNLGHERDVLIKAVTDFSEDMARDLMVFRKIAYEIRSDEEADRHGNFVRLPGFLINLGFAYLHFVPIQYSRTAHLRGFKAEPSLLRKKKVFVFKLPRKLYSWREYLWLKHRLIASSKISPDFSLDDLKSNNPTPGYNFIEYHKASVIELLLSLKKTGMQLNSIAEEYSLGYYTTDLALRFYRTMAVMRQSLIAQINEMLKQAGIEEKIVLEGAPLPEEVDEVRNELQEGKIDFAEAWKRIKQKDDE